MTLSEMLRRMGVAVFTVWLLGAAGCNTVEGFGEDVEAAGDAIEDEAGDRR